MGHFDLSFKEAQHVFVGAMIKNNSDFVGYANGNNQVLLIRNNESPSVVELFTNLNVVGTTPPTWNSGQIGYNNLEASTVIALVGEYLHKSWESPMEQKCLSQDRTKIEIDEH